MPVIDFPSSPSSGQTFSSGGKTWTYDGTGWVLNYTSAASGLTRVSTTPPPSPQNGDVWIDSNTWVQYAYYADGTSNQWVELAPNVAQTPTYVTSLPSGPIDGQEIYYAADATNGVIWHLRYRAASSSSYKWEFVGGTPLQAQTNVSDTSGNTQLPTTDTSVCELTLPVGGTWSIEYGIKMSGVSGTTAAYATLYAGASSVSGSITYVATTNNPPTFNHRLFAPTDYAASTVVSLRVRTDTSNAGAWYQSRFLRIAPVRVG